MSLATTRTLAHARWESSLLLRNGEQLLLTIVIPVAILLLLTKTDALKSSVGADRVPSALATALTVSVLGASFTSLAIATGFERRSGALRFLSTTPLTRADLLVGKFLATGAVILVSAAAACVVALVIGWRPAAGSLWAVPLLLLSGAAGAAWGVALSGMLRAEAVLAVANAIFLILILFGGVVIPASSLPGPMSAVAPWLPSGATADLLHQALVAGQAPSLGPVLILVAWIASGALVATRTFRWS
jgi:ABC-2 type transport system permease protein